MTSPRWQAVLAAVAVLVLPSALLAQGAPGGQRPPPTVTVVTLKAQDVTLTADLPGRVVASGVAEVRPQVNGIIRERLYREGSDVTVGEPLYRIDPASYEARVAASRAQVTQAEARLRAIEREAARLQELVRRNVASEQAFDEATSARDAAAAAIEVAKADLLAAEIDLDRTTIRAPLAGVIGRSLTTEGALVTSGQAQPLAIIRGLDPVLVDVTQSAAEVLAWRRGVMAERLRSAEQTVRLRLADGKEYEHPGSLTAAEAYVNEQTGVVTLRLTFPNPDRLLLPGMYVQVALPQGVVEGAVLAPMQGVSFDRRGQPTALVVNGDGVVEPRVLELVGPRGPNWIVRAGLLDGDKLIVEGVQRVRPGAPARPEERGAPPAATPAAARP